MDLSQCQVSWAVMGLSQCHVCGDVFTQFHNSVSPQTTPKQHEDLKAVREHVRECFNSLSCYLMPSPGTKVQSGDSDGRLEGEGAGRR